MARSAVAMLSRNLTLLASDGAAARAARSTFCLAPETNLTTWDSRVLELVGSPVEVEVGGHRVPYAAV